MSRSDRCCTATSVSRQHEHHTHTHTHTHWTHRPGVLTWPASEPFNKQKNDRERNEPPSSPFCTLNPNACSRTTTSCEKCITHTHIHTHTNHINDFSETESYFKQEMISSFPLKPSAALLRLWVIYWVCCWTDCYLLLKEKLTHASEVAKLASECRCLYCNKQEQEVPLRNWSNWWNWSNMNRSESW